MLIVLGNISHSLMKLLC